MNKQQAQGTAQVGVISKAQQIMYVFFGGGRGGMKNMWKMEMSEAAACDGILYRVGPEDDNTNPGPGILPI